VNAIQNNGYTLVTQAIKDQNIVKFVEYMANPTIDVNKFDARAGNPLINALLNYTASSITEDGNEETYRSMVWRLLSAPGIDVNRGINESILVLVMKTHDRNFFNQILANDALRIHCDALNEATVQTIDGFPYFLNRILIDRRLDSSYGFWPRAVTAAENPIRHVVRYYDSIIADRTVDGRGELTEAVTTDVLRQLLAYKPEWADGIDLSRFDLTFPNIHNDPTSINRRHTARNAATVSWMRARGLPRAAAAAAGAGEAGEAGGAGGAGAAGHAVARKTRKRNSRSKN